MTGGMVHRMAVWHPDDDELQIIVAEHRCRPGACPRFPPRPSNEELIEGVLDGSFHVRRVAPRRPD